MVLWLKGDEGVTKNGSNFVSSWADGSRNGNNATQSSTNQMPLWVDGVFNGKPILRFSGSQYFTAGNNSSLTYTNLSYFLVISFVDPSATQAILSKDAGSGNTNKWIYFLGYAQSQAMTFLVNPGNAVMYEPLNNLQTHQMNLVGLTKNNSIYSFYQNADLNGSVTNSTRIRTINSDFRIGQAEGGFYLNGDIGEIIVYNRAIKTMERHAIEQYLADKYSIATPPIIDPKGGNFKNPTTVKMTSVLGTSIRYTLDGTEPDANSTLYTKPFILKADTVVKAKAFRGVGFSDTVTAIFYIGDSDQDGLPDWWELKYFGNLNQGPGDDPDGDGLTNLQEYQYGTDPTKFDTNGDGLSDGADVALGINPTDMDVDHDGLSNAQEILMGTNPFNPDTDGDGVPDGQDPFPLDPTRWSLPSPDPNDHTPPTITLEEPDNTPLP